MSNENKENQENLENQEIKENKEEKKKDKGPAAKRGTLGSIYSTYRSEFFKIVWPSRPELIRKTITVAIVSALFGVYISVLDGIFGMIFTTVVGFLD